MELAVFACEACDARIDVAAPKLERIRFCPVCLAPRVSPPEQAEPPQRSPGLHRSQVLTAFLVVVLVVIGVLAGRRPSAAVARTPAAATSPGPKPAPIVTSTNDVPAPEPGPKPAPIVTLPDEVPAPETSTEAPTAVRPPSPAAAPVQVAVSASPPAPTPAPSAEGTLAVRSRPKEPPAAVPSPARRRPLPLPQVDLNENDAPRIRVRTESGGFAVARVVGAAGGQAAVLLPDGRTGTIWGLPQYTSDPFVPATMDQIRQELTADGQPFARFHVKQSRRYLVLYQSTPAYAEASLRLLEGLYRGLFDAFRRRSMPVREAEFPLVVIIFRTERDFRAHAPTMVNPLAIAYYEVGSNRVYMYQKSDRDQQDPEHAALMKPETVAHEGTHQILQNIGIHPRPSDWPPWLIEGLAEYCAPPTMTRHGAAWGGIGQVHVFDLASLRRIGDSWTATAKAENPPGVSAVQRLVSLSQLTTHDEYARAWALTHYLAHRRGSDFLAYLKALGRVPPLAKFTPADHLAAFRAAFGADLAKMDQAIAAHLAGLKLDLPLRKGEGRAVDRPE